MMEQKIAGKTVTQWQTEHSLLTEILQMKEVFWVNPLAVAGGEKASRELGEADIDDAEARLARFAPYIAKVFPETSARKGIIESPLKKIPQMKQALAMMYDAAIDGELYLKCDNDLPISGSIKARGGIYEVLKVAEDIAKAAGILTEASDYALLADDACKQLFSSHSIVVGSTGNLGLSIGIMSAALGFQVTVHMSADAKQWKKDLLRQKGVTVVEHQADYGKAVAAGREQSAQDPKSYFVDDENSKNLFLGYAVAAKRLKRQLDEQGILVDADHPLFVYLPCGVGGGPGGVTFGLKTVFSDAAHCFFAEPTHSPAMLLGLMTGKHEAVSVQEFGIDNLTAADGLAVGRPSGFVGRFLAKDISGVFTIEDDRLYELLATLADQEGIYAEPSALAGFGGPAAFNRESAGKEYVRKQGLSDKMGQATHVVWATGGSMVPENVMADFYRQGKEKLPK
ncbi:MAG: D-serine ammonia-lyase [Sporomusaceae bacterium]|nr:D-serine ammonia-lyase [Sporomusaceae bacterium]